MQAIEARWDEIKETIRKEYDLSDVSYHTWIEPLKFYDVQDDVVIILITSNQSHALNYISSKYKDFFRVTLTEMMDHYYEVSFILEKDAKKDKSSTEDLKSPYSSTFNINYENANLNPKYKFDTFVVGSNNKFAHSACLAVAESPGDAYNPLYIYGGAGLGKTHLMHSIGHFVLEQNPDMKVIYVTSESFTNEVIESIRSGNAAAMTKLRDKYRTVAILRKNAENYDKKIDDSIFQYIATNIKSNIRELEGAFNRIIAKSKIENQPEITMELAEDALKDIINPDKPDKITPELIIRVVAEHYGVNPEDITSKKRNSEFVLPRQVVMYLCRDLTETSLANIGKLLGKKDHTTVIHGANKITDELNTNEELKNNIEIIKKKICV